MTHKVVLTDHPWPDVAIEQAIFDAAGIELIAGPVAARDAAAIEADIQQHRPHAIMCCWAPVSQRAIEASDELKIVSRMGVGLDNIAVAAATARGVWVTNVPDYCVEEVSDHVIAMILGFWRGTHHFDREAKNGRWEPATANLKRSRNRTVGIIGYGRIGQVTARKFAQGFGTKVLVHSPSLMRDYGDGAEVAQQIYAASIATIRAESDAIVLHLPLATDNRHMIDDRFIAGLKRKPVIVNVSRGGLIDNSALIRGLDSGALGGAALDVIEGEPNPPHAIMSRRDVIVTPHIAFSSDASLTELRQRCSEEVVRVLKGLSPLHPCNVPRS